MNDLSTPRGCHDPKGWLARPEITIQLRHSGQPRLSERRRDLLILMPFLIYLIKRSKAAEMLVENEGFCQPGYSEGSFPISAAFEGFKRAALKG